VEVVSFATKTRALQTRATFLFDTLEYSDFPSSSSSSSPRVSLSAVGERSGKKNIARKHESPSHQLPRMGKERMVVIITSILPFRLKQKSKLWVIVPSRSYSGSWCPEHRFLSQTKKDFVARIKALVLHKPTAFPSLLSPHPPPTKNTQGKKEDHKVDHAL